MPDSIRMQGRIDYALPMQHGNASRRWAELHAWKFHGLPMRSLHGSDAKGISGKKLFEKIKEHDHDVPLKQFVRA